VEDEHRQHAQGSPGLDARPRAGAPGRRPDDPAPLLRRVHPRLRGPGQGVRGRHAHPRRGVEGPGDRGAPALRQDPDRAPRRSRRAT
jgi:hypothetical protein